MNKQYVFWLCALFVLFDLGYSYSQHYQLPLEGDVAAIILPSPWYSRVLQDPFGWAVVTKNEMYAGPNRYFAHLCMIGYLRYVPLWLQRFTDPINSIYVACALFKTGVQALLLYLLALYSTGAQRYTDRALWVAAALLVPLFQGGGYNEQMGVIEQSITYTIFYAFPLALLLLLLLPVYRAAYRRQPLRLSWAGILASVVLMVVLAFNGPIVTGTIMVLLMSVFLYWARTHWLGAWQPSWAGWWSQLMRLPLQLLFLLALLAALCLYSLYVGRNNLENLTHVLPLGARYKLVPHGIVRQLTSALGFPLLLAVCLANAQLIRSFLPPTAQSRWLLRALQLLGLFSLLYILFLPLGGYRIYRPFILRRDSILPIILGLMYFYGASSYYLLRQLPAAARRWYAGGLLLVGAIYMNADQLQMTNSNACERQALGRLAQASEPIVEVDNSCTVLAWELLTNPQQSAFNAQLLEFWGVTTGNRLYYQQAAEQQGAIIDRR